MAWQQISVCTDEHTAPNVADMLSDYGALSVTYMDALDEPVYEPAIGETKIWTKTQVIALFELAEDLGAIKTAVLQQFQKNCLQDWLIEKIEDQPWERAWMEHYQPMKFGDKLWVCPTDRIRQEANTVCLRLDPGLAFGTGTHPTTSLCLEWLANHHDLTGKIVIDYGCGSGILAIAAVLLGAKYAYAIDIDPQAITATEMNADKNQVADKVFCCMPEQFRRKQVKADVVLANILAKPLIEMANDISMLADAGGYIVLSGILAEQAGAVVSAYTPGLTLSDTVQKEEWIRLVGLKN